MAYRGSTATQACLDLFEDCSSREAPVIGLGSHGEEHLGCENCIPTPASQRLADDLFGLSAGVPVGRIDEVDTGFERCVDDANAVGMIGVAPGAEHHGAEAERGDFNVSGSKIAIVHERSSVVRVSTRDFTTLSRGDTRRQSREARWERGRALDPVC